MRPSDYPMSIFPSGLILPLLSLFLVSLWSTTVEARTIYVDSDYNTENGGTSWSDAIGLRDVNNISVNGDVVFIKERTYSYSSPTVIDKQLELYGGFSGNESPSDPEHRDWWNHKTILRGDAAIAAIETKATTRIDGFFFEHCSCVGLRSDASTTVVNCVFRKNGGSIIGGAIDHWYKEDSLTLINCLFVDNLHVPYSPEIVSSRYATIALTQESPLTLIHCTIANNSIQGYEGEFYGISPSENLKIINSIIRNPISTPTGPADVTYSNIIYGFEGKGNIDADPHFDYQYNLLPDSPCIDMGTASEVLYDIRNLSRPIDIPGVGFDGSVAFDMGAFEFRLADIPTPTRTQTQTRTPEPTQTPTLTETPTNTRTNTKTETPLPTPTVDSHADINGDGKIGPDDLLILQREWGRSVE